MKQTKVLFIISQLAVGGAERQLLELVKHLDKDKYLPKVCSLSEKTQLGEYFRKAGVEIAVIGRKHSIDFNRLLQLYRLLKREKPIIVHTFMHSANTYGRIAAKLAGVPIIIASERGFNFLDRSWIRIQIDRLLAKFSQQLVTNSKELKQSIVKFHRINQEKVITIYNGIDVLRFDFKINVTAQKRELKLNLTSPTVGIVARLTPVKNHACFLQAARKVLGRFPNTKFLIVGDGELREALESMAEGLELSDNVIFTGSRSDVPQLLSILDVSVLCSFSEGMPNAVLESMASGKPVVVTDVGGCSEIVKDGEDGFLVASDNPHALAEKIKRLLVDRDAAKAMGRTGRKRIEEQFTIGKMVKNYEQLYANLLQAKGKTILGH